MSRSPHLFFLTALLFFLPEKFSWAAEDPLVSATIVVYNKSIPESVQLATFYAQKRGIAKDHLIGLNCSNDEEISREQYDTTIAKPLREIFKQRGWWTLRKTAEQNEVAVASSIHFVALIKGVPLKIRPSATPEAESKSEMGPVLAHNEASVDSELSVLAFHSATIAGAIPNAYYQSFRRIGDFANAIVLLVCRLDGPNAAVVRNMIVSAIAAEKNGLWGRAYIDSSHNSAPGAGMGDEWFSQISEQLRKAGIPLVYEDTPAVFADGYPMSDCALYYGWYAGQVTGPFAQPIFEFVPGAIAVHIHSFSANTLRDPNANWVAPLLSRGAAASLGNVYEPFLQLTAHLDIFNDRLLHGFTFAESAYMSVQGLSWMSVMVGDPLYRPYGSWLQIDRPPDTGKNDWKMCHDFATKYGSRPPREYRELARKAAAQARNGPMIEDLGSIEAGEGNLAAAIDYFQQARSSYTKRDDILRVVLEQVDALIKENKRKRALELVTSVLPIVSESPTGALLRKIQEGLRSPNPQPVTNP